MLQNGNLIVGSLDNFKTNDLKQFNISEAVFETMTYLHPHP
jgi:hypothetical protein